MASSNKVNVALIAKELPRTCKRTGERRGGGEGMATEDDVGCDDLEEGEEENAFGFGEYLMNSLDVLKVVSSV